MSDGLPAQRTHLIYTGPSRALVGFVCAFLMAIALALVSQGLQGLGQEKVVWPALAIGGGSGLILICLCLYGLQMFRVGVRVDASAGIVAVRMPGGLVWRERVLPLADVISCTILPEDYTAQRFTPGVGLLGAANAAANVLAGPETHTGHVIALCRAGTAPPIVVTPLRRNSDPRSLMPLAERLAEALNRPLETPIEPPANRPES